MFGFKHISLFVAAILFPSFAFAGVLRPNMSVDWYPKALGDYCSINTALSSMKFSVNFTEWDQTKEKFLPVPVTGFSAAGILVQNGTLHAFSGDGVNYTFEVTPNTPGGSAEVGIPANTVKDATGNSNDMWSGIGGNESYCIVNFEAPGPLLATIQLGGQPAPGTTWPIPFEVRFNKVIRCPSGTIVSSTDPWSAIKITNGWAEPYSHNGIVDQSCPDSQTLAFLVVPTGTPVTVQFAAGMVADYTGLGTNTASAPFTFNYSGDFGPQAPNGADYMACLKSCTQGYALCSA
jgi:hypothetical protein